MRKKILSIDDLDDGDLSRLFFRARSMKTQRAFVKNERSVMITAFFEASTRTKLSFSLAALKLGMGVLNFEEESSSLKKGESIKDTLRTIGSLGADLLVIRSKEVVDRGLLEALPCGIINAGDGINEHPSQALLDCLTLLNTFKSDTLVGKKILIAGDIAHSRVARSNYKLMTRLGAQLSLLEPPCFKSASFIPKTVARYGQFEETSGDFDAVMMLRIQKERQGDAIQLRDSEYFELYGLSEKRLRSLGEKCVVLHPGPMNLGVEIEAKVAYGERSLIDVQVENGVYMRAALIGHCTD